MREIVVVYPVKDIAVKLKRFFEQEGFFVSHVCALGSTALKLSNDMSSGIIVCAERLSDMTAGNLAELLPADFDVVALTRNSTDSIMSNLIYVQLPLERDELVDTVARLAGSYSSFTKREDSDRALINKAKQIIMRRDSIPETQAHKLLQQMSMRTGKSLKDVAREIIDTV